jgi:predicted methyltransferase
VNIQRIITSFESIIQGLIKDLEKYAKRENANQLYIDKQNILIRNLIGIHNTINSIRFLELWQNIDTEMQRLEELDKQLSGHSIHLQCRPTGHNFSRITYNPFKL